MIYHALLPIQCDEVADYKRNLRLAWAEKSTWKTDYVTRRGSCVPSAMPYAHFAYIVVYIANL